MRVDFFNVRVHALKALADTQAYTSARIARAHACTPISCPSEGNSAVDNKNNPSENGGLLPKQ